MHASFAISPEQKQMWSMLAALMSEAHRDQLTAFIYEDHPINQSVLEMRIFWKDGVTFSSHNEISNAVKKLICEVAAQSSTRFKNFATLLEAQCRN